MVMVRKKRLNETLTWYHTPHFPFKNVKRLKGFKVIIGIGGNIGDCLRRFERLWWLIARRKDIHIKAVSPILRNPPFGYLHQPDFYNGVMIIHTYTPPKLLMKKLLQIEQKFGRKRSFRDAPRTLDLDMICYENRRIATPFLTLPHPKKNERLSVQLPLQTIKEVL